jgi:Protein of unknown function (DUF4232)
VHTRNAALTITLMLGAAGLLAGCGSSSNGSTTSEPTGGVTPTAHPTHPPTSTTPTIPPTSAAPTPTATVTVTAAPAVSRCLSSHLKLTLGLGQGAAGTTYQVIVFTNEGSAACELHGYPGVSFVDASGAQLGRPATEDPGKRKTHVLDAAGGQANALLRQPDPGNFPASSCHVTTADRLKVYPPGETVALFVHDAVQVCTTAAGRTGIGPVLAGNGG